MTNNTEIQGKIDTHRKAVVKILRSTRGYDAFEMQDKKPIRPTNRRSATRKFRTGLSEKV